MNSVAFSWHCGLHQLMKAAVPAKSYAIHHSSASLVSCDVYGQQPGRCSTLTSLLIHFLSKEVVTLNGFCWGKTFSFLFYLFIYIFFHFADLFPLYFPFWTFFIGIIYFHDPAAIIITIVSYIIIILIINSTAR